MRRGDAAEADDGHLDRLAHLIHHAQRDGADGGAGQAREHVVEHRAALVEVDGHGLERIHKAQAVRARVFAREGHLGDVLGVRRELDDERLRRVLAHAGHHLMRAVGLDAVRDAARLDVRARDVQLDEIDVRRVEQARAFFIRLDGAAAEVRHHGRAERAHRGQLVLDEVAHAGVLQTDGVDEPGRRLKQAHAGVAGLALERQALAGHRADPVHVDDAREFAAETVRSGRADDGGAQLFAAQIHAQISHRTHSPRTPGRPCRRTPARPFRCGTCSRGKRRGRRPSRPPC